MLSPDRGYVAVRSHMGFGLVWFGLVGLGWVIEIE